MKKVLSLFLVFTALMSIVVGCSGKAPASDGTVVGTAAETGKTVQDTGGQARKVELKVFMSMPQFKEQIDKYLGQFIAKEKTEKNIELKINLDMPPNDKANEILRVRLAAGNTPDIFTINPTADIPDYYKAGYLSDLSEQPFTADVFDNVKAVCSLYGKVYAMPLESSAWGYLYNKKIFSDNGITPPKTIDEMKTVVEKLKAANIKPFMLAYQDGWVAQLLHALAVQGTIYASRPDFVDTMNAGTGSYRDIQSIFEIIDLVDGNGTDKPSEVGYMTGAADFANGKAAMWVMGTWAADPILQANKDIELGCAPLPVSNDPKAAMLMLSVSSALAAGSNSKNQDAAFDLINYMLDPKDSSGLFESLKWNQIASFHTYSTFPWTDESMKFVGEGYGHPEIKLPEAVSGSEAPKQMQAYAAGIATKDDVIKALDKAWADAVKAAAGQ